MSCYGNKNNIFGRARVRDRDFHCFWLLGLVLATDVTRLNWHPETHSKQIEVFKKAQICHIANICLVAREMAEAWLAVEYKHFFQSTITHH